MRRWDGFTGRRLDLMMRAHCNLCFDASTSSAMRTFVWGKQATDDQWSPVCGDSDAAWACAGDTPAEQADAASLTRRPNGCAPNCTESEPGCFAPNSTRPTEPPVLPTPAVTDPAA
jgi:hypothetical protein